MLLKKLLDGIVYEGENVDDIEVKDIKIDSRRVEKGDLFIAIKGQESNGCDFISDAFKNGAVAVLTEENIKGCIRVSNARSVYALVCKNFFEKACDKFKIIAVTGTNGKTTTCTITRQVLSYAGLRTGIIGTLGAGEDNLSDTGFTTPDPYALHKIFKQMKESGVEYVVMEASAHALALDKLEGISFEVGVLTNITEDHLDFFGNMDSYSKAKFKLFESGRVKLGIICGDDLYGRRLLLQGNVPMVSYGLGEGSDFYPVNICQDENETQFKCIGLGKEFQVKCPLIGDYNVQNVLASIGICTVLGVPNELICLGLSCITPVEGRFNIIKMGGIKVIIDFAHTPDGLEKVLLSARKITSGKVKVLFGCGGNRDSIKRPIMGKVAEDFSDEVVLTSDNPRFEDPQTIMNEIAQGMSKPCVKIADRKKAICEILSSAQEGDTIVVAGKGGEKYQDINGEKIPYNDFDQVYAYFRNQIKQVLEKEN